MPYQIKVVYDLQDGRSEELNKLFKEGWRPLGGVQYVNTRFKANQDYITLFKE